MKAIIKTLTDLKILFFTIAPLVSIFLSVYHLLFIKSLYFFIMFIAVLNPCLYAIRPYSALTLC